MLKTSINLSKRLLLQEIGLRAWWLLFCVEDLRSEDDAECQRSAYAVSAYRRPGSVGGRHRSPIDRFETLAREPALPRVWMAGLVYFGPSFT